MKETDNQAVERVVPLANENDVSISLTKDGKVGTERRAGMRIVDVRMENYRGVRNAEVKGVASKERPNE